MGCAHPKLQAQQIAYQRDFLGACWNSALGDEEVNEYVPSRWMGVSKQVMSLNTGNHCFSVRAQGKEEDATAPAKGSRKRRWGSTRDAVAPLPRSPGELGPRDEGSSPNLGASAVSRQNSEHASATVGVGAVDRGAGAATPAALRAVMKSSTELEKIAHSHHPYLQRHELSVFGGVIFRCAPARRLYQRISLVPPSSRKKYGGDLHGTASASDHCTVSAVAPPPPPVAQICEGCTSSTQRPLDDTPLFSARDGTDVRHLQEGRLDKENEEAERCVVGRDEDRGKRESAPPLRLLSSLASQRIPEVKARASDDPFSALNNYPIEDRDVAGVMATRPPVIVGSITAAELQALPSNAEVSFGGWLYVSLHDEQLRLRRSLAKYEARQQRHAAKQALSTKRTSVKPAASELPAGVYPADEALQRHRAAPHSACASPHATQEESPSDDDDFRKRSRRATKVLLPLPNTREQDVSIDSHPLSAPRTSTKDNVLKHPSGKAHPTITQPENLLRGTGPAPAAAPTCRDDDEEGEGEDGGNESQKPHAQEAVVRTEEKPDRWPAPSEPLEAHGDASGPAHSLKAASSVSEEEDGPSPADMPSLGRFRKRASSMSHWPAGLIQRRPSVGPTPHTGKYVMEAMEADALVATWLPCAYIIIVIPMYECSLLPTTFHTAFTRRKAVSLNLANASSRQAYGVGCITSTRYGGLLVIEYRDKVMEDEDAEWIRELLRVGRLAQGEVSGGAGSDHVNLGCRNRVNAEGSQLTSSAASVLSSRRRPSLSSPAHQARAKAVHCIKTRIVANLRRQGVDAVLAATRMAQRQRRQRRATTATAKAVEGDSWWLPTPALEARPTGLDDAVAGAAPSTRRDMNKVTPLSTPPSRCGRRIANSTAQPPSPRLNGYAGAWELDDDSGLVGDDGVDDVEDAAGEVGSDVSGIDDTIDSQCDSSSSSSEHRDRERGKRDGHHFWPFKDHHASAAHKAKERVKRKKSEEFRISARGADGHHSSISGRRAVNKANITGETGERPHGWPSRRFANDFLLRGTFRQVGGMKYLDAISLMDGCPVSELVQGIRRWVMNLLSMPIKARPLSLYLQRYEGIASSLRLLNTQVIDEAMATSVKHGSVMAPGNLSFNASVDAGVTDDSVSFAARRPADGAGGGAAAAALVNSSFSAATGALVNASFAAADTRYAASRPLSYNTYYRGPLDPMVRAVLSPEVESTIAACQKRLLLHHLPSPESHGIETVARTVPTREMGPLSPVGVVVAPHHETPPSGHLNGRSNAVGVSGAVPMNLPVSVAHLHGVADVAPVSGVVNQEPNDDLSDQLSITSPSVPHLDLLRTLAETDPAGGGRPQAHHVDPLSIEDPHGITTLSGAVLCVNTNTMARPDDFPAPSPEGADHSAVPPNEVPTTITECLLYDDPTVKGTTGNCSFTAANGRALAAAAAAAMLTGTAVRNGLSATADFSVAASSHPPDVHRRSHPNADIDALGVPAQRRASEPAPLSITSAGDDDVRPRPEAAGAPPLKNGAETVNEEGEGRRGEKRYAAKALERARQTVEGTAPIEEDDHEESVREHEWYLADRELRALRTELDEMHFLVSTAREELLERLQECIQFGALFLPHTRPDQVSLSLLTMKMLRQYPEEVPVKEIHTDWIPVLMGLLTLSRERLLCCAGYDGGDLEHPVGDTWSFLTTYSNAVAPSDVCDANRRRELYNAGTTKYMIEPLPPLPVPQLLHDIVIAPQPICFSKAALLEMTRVGMDGTGLSFTFSGGALGVLAGVLHYYADFLRSKYRSEVAAVGGHTKEAGATVQDVLLRGGYNVLLQRIWIWGATSDFGSTASSFSSSPGVSVAKTTKRMLLGKLSHRDSSSSSNASVPSTPRVVGRTAHVVTNTTALTGARAQVVRQPFSAAEAFALYDAVVYYLRVLEELHQEHQGTNSLAPQAPIRRRSILMSWRRGKDTAESGGSTKDAAGDGGCRGDAPVNGTGAPPGESIVPTFEICVATNYYYKKSMEETGALGKGAGGTSSAGPVEPTNEARTWQHSQAPSPKDGVPAMQSPARSGGAGNPGCPPAAADLVNGSAAPTGKALNGPSAGRAKKTSVTPEQLFEQPYCGGEEAEKKNASERRERKKFYNFLHDQFEQWRMRHMDDRAVSNLSKRIQIHIR